MRTPNKICRPSLCRFPFTIWGAIALSLEACILIFELSYDQGGVAGALVLSSPIWGFMYSLPSEILFGLNDGTAIPGQTLVTVLAGLIFCLLADLVFRRWLARNR